MSQKIRLRVKDGLILNQDNIIVAVCSEFITDQDVAAIELGSELCETSIKFIDHVNTGFFKPKSEVKEFQKVFDKHEEHLFLLRNKVI